MSIPKVLVEKKFHEGEDIVLESQPGDALYFLTEGAHQQWTPQHYRNFNGRFSKLVLSSRFGHCDDQFF